MESLPKYYTVLFNAVTDALEAIQRQDYVQAQILLYRGQQQAESAYLTATDPADPPSSSELMTYREK